MSKRISRSAFIWGLAGTGLVALSGKLSYDFIHYAEQIPCRILGPSRDLGHMLKDAKVDLKDAKISASKKLVIVGGGIAGLSAAWWLKQQGFSDFVLFELENNVGGNSSSGSNKISAYPWGAHYVPIANEESVYLRMLFEELGIIESYNEQGLPFYNELYLCHDPQERLFKDGGFQEGLVPKKGLQDKDQKEMERFFQLVADYKKKRGKDAKPAFAIPLDLSSQDEELLALDRISMADWMKANDFNSRPLQWYVNYCCRDDYGSSPAKVSAWAGLHYFAGRTGKAQNAETNSVVTWPEGNGFLVNRLKEKLDGHIITGSMVSRIECKLGRIKTSFLKTGDHSIDAIESDLLLFSAPRFLAPYLIAEHEKYDLADHSKLVYPPWMVANISLRKLPFSKGEAIAWDNVSYYGESLGYVVATHQNISTREGAAVVTFYMPLSEDEPRVAREKLLKAQTTDWTKRIISELEKMHPGIRQDIISIDLCPWGHGMLRPSIAFIWSDARRKMKESPGPIFFAHSDMSGMSNFEEAQYQGVESARRILAGLQERT